MSFYEKPDDDFSQKEPEVDQENNEDITNIEENKRNSLNNQNNNNQNITKKKNRTLQYYKFLFYTMKTEIKVHDFLKLLRNSNTAELSLWTISVVLFANIPKSFSAYKSSSRYNGVFLWLHLMHVIRAFFGMYIGYKLPRSYQIMDILQTISDEKLAKTLFNDIIRETLLKHVIITIKEKRIFIFIYFFSTVLNFIFDIIDFIIVLSKLSKCEQNTKVMFITYFIIAIIYLVLDFAYFFWAGQLKLIFPPEYLKPITDLYNGIIDRAIITFKLGKDKTHVISEAKAQQNKGPYVKESGNMNNGGVNLLQFIMKDSLGVYDVEERDKYLPQINKERDINNNRNNEPYSSEVLN